MKTWRDDAACKGMGPRIFFPEREGPQTLREAHQVCAGCPVREDCFQFATRNHIVFGIWGGMTIHPRRAEVRRRRRSVA